MAASLLPIHHTAELSSAVLENGHGEKGEAQIRKSLGPGSVLVWRHDLALGHFSTGANLRANHLACLEKERHAPNSRRSRVLSTSRAPLLSQIPVRG